MGTDSFGVISRLAAPALKSSDGSCAWLKEENVKQETMSHQLRAEKFTRTTLHAGRRNVNFYSPVSNGGRARLSSARRRTPVMAPRRAGLLYTKFCAKREGSCSGTGTRDF